MTKRSNNCKAVGIRTNKYLKEIQGIADYTGRIGKLYKNGKGIIACDFGIL